MKMELIYSFLPTFIITCVSFILGYLTIERLKIFNFISKIEIYFFSSITGLVELSVIAFLLLLLHSFYFVFTIILFSIFLLYFISKFKSELNIKELLTKNELKMLLLVLVIFIPIVIPLALHPPIAWDSIEAHLPVAEKYATSHYLIYNVYFRADFFPHATEMLYALVYLFYPSGIAMQLLSSYFFFLLLTGVFSISKRIYGYKLSIIASVLLIGMPLSLWLSSVGYTDMYLSLLLLATSYLLILKNEKNNEAIYIITGILAGGAIGVKQTAGVYWLIIVIAHIFLDIKYKRNSFKSGIIYHVLIVLAVAGPWYLRSWFLTGSPIYPFAIGILGNAGPWSNPEIIAQLKDMNGGRFGGILSSSTYLKQLLTNNYGAEGFEQPLSQLFSVGLILSIFTSIFWKKAVQRLIFVSILYFCFIAFESIHIRYLFPIIPILVIVSASGLLFIIMIIQKLIELNFKLFDNIKLYNKDYISKVLICMLFLIVIYPGIKYSIKNLMDTGITLDENKQESFLMKKLPSYEAFQYLNNNYGSNYKVYGVHQENMQFYCKGQLIGDWFGADSFGRVLGGTSLTQDNIISVCNYLTNSKINFMIISSDDIQVTNAELLTNFNLIKENNKFKILAPKIKS